MNKVKTPKKRSSKRERALIERIRNGDQDAFTSLYRAHKMEVFRTALHIVKDHEVAADITQDVFIKFFTHLDNFDDNRPILPWLKQITRNHALNWVTRKDKKELPLDAIEEVFNRDEKSPDEIISDMDRLDRINTLFDEVLNPRESHILRLWTYEEDGPFGPTTANKFGLPKQRIWKIYVQAMNKLRRYREKYGIDI